MARSKLISTVALAIIVLLLETLSAACAPVGDTEETETVNGMTASTPEFETIEIEPGKDVSPTGLPSRVPSECPDLDSVLYQIVQAPDPIKLAEQYQLRVNGDKIQVLLIIESNEVSFLRDYEVEIGKQSGNQVQAFVAIQHLCTLANTEEVLAIRQPAQATLD